MCQGCLPSEHDPLGCALRLPALLFTSSVATAIALTGGPAYLAHAITVARGDRRVLSALWVATVACSSALMAPLIAAGLPRCFSQPSSPTKKAPASNLSARTPLTTPDDRAASPTTPAPTRHRRPNSPQPRESGREPAMFRAGAKRWPGAAPPVPRGSLRSDNARIARSRPARPGRRASAGDETPATHGAESVDRVPSG